MALGNKQDRFSFEKSVARIMGATWPPPESKEARAQALAAGLIPDEAMLAALSIALGAATIPNVTKQEAALLNEAPDVPGDLISSALDKIQEGGDPLGEAFCELRPAAIRRKDGAVYTPAAIVQARLSRAESIGEPDRVTDPGAGSGRFLVERDDGSRVRCWWR